MSGRGVYEARNVTKVYPGQNQPANRDISFCIHEGEIFGILGENGAGKTTLVRQMVNLIPSTSGSITLFGRSVLEDPMSVSMNVGYMPQESLILGVLTVAETLYFTAHLRGLSANNARNERDRLLDLWQLGDVRHKACVRLSGGQKRLVQIAVGMAASPPVMILDEPTSNLDPQRRRLVWDVLRQMNSQAGTTLIFITHDAVEAEKIVQRVAIMRAGEIVALGAPHDMKRGADQRLRLELFFSPDQPPRLPEGLTCHKLDAGRWLVHLERSQVMDVLGQLDLDNLDDYRLQSATLEDLYFHYAAPTD